MKSYNEQEIRRIFKSQNYKYASLRNSDGKSIVTYNTENNKSVKASNKVDEAFERLKILPDGIYIFCFANSKGRNVQPDEFHFIKGNMATDEMGKPINYQVINQAPSKTNEYERVLSYPEVISLQMELTRTKFELDSTRRELDKANLEIASLESEIKELEAKGLSDNDPSSPMKWVENLGSTFMPVIDKIMTQRDRELRLKEQKFYASRNRQQSQPSQNTLIKLPEIGSQELENLIDIISNYDDDKYQFTMNEIKKQSLEHYNYIVNALEQDEEEEDENE